MNYPEFLAKAEKLGGQPSPAVWQHIEQRLWPQNVLAFPRLRLMLIAAMFLFVGVLPTSVLMAGYERQQMFNYLQPIGSTEYLAVASNYSFY